MSHTKDSFISIVNIIRAQDKLKGVATRTPLTEHNSLNEAFNANILLKREDLQIVRSYKIRGAYNRMSSLSQKEKDKGIVCASAGNHAQGVAYSCFKLGIHGKIFMPATTTSQKIDKVKMFGKSFIEVILKGDAYDDSYNAARIYEKEHGLSFIHPFDDELVIAGQGTVGIEILEELNTPLDYLFIPIGGGGLCCGVGSYVKQISPHTKIIGVEPAGAPAMKRSLELGVNTALVEMDSFVDGAAVKRVGDMNFRMAKDILDDIVLVPEGRICSWILKLYNEEAIVVEPAGALSIAALDYYKEEIKGKSVCAIVSGGNNDIIRMAEIKERSQLFEGLKHYFIIRLAQRPGALKEFITNVLGPNDDICHFEYTKKNNRGTGPIVLGLEFQRKEDYESLMARMDEQEIFFQRINDNPELFQFLV